DCGRTYPPGDADAGARALLAALATPGLGASARAAAERRFDVRETRARYHRLVREAASPPPAAAPPTSLTLVTVTHDSEPELARLLASVDRHLPGAQLIVVDSGSRDGSAALAR